MKRRIGSQVVNRRGGGDPVRRDRTAAAFLQLLIVIEHVKVGTQRTLTKGGCARLEIAYVNQPYQRVAIATGMTWPTVATERLYLATRHVEVGLK